MLAKRKLIAMNKIVLTLKKFEINEICALLITSHPKKSLPLSINLKQKRTKLRHNGYDKLGRRENIMKDKMVLTYKKNWDTHRKIFIFDTAPSTNTQSGHVLQRK